MKCLMISPRNGMVRISRFTTEKFEVQTRRSADFELMNETEAMDDLLGRSIAPLRLSAALRARLPSVLSGPTDG